MKGISLKFAVAAVSLGCLVGLAACGHEVPSDTPTAPEFSAAGEIVENPEDPFHTTEAPVTAIPVDEDDENKPTTAASSNGFVAVTRTGTATKKPSGGSSNGTVTTKVPGGSGNGSTANGNGTGSKPNGITLSYYEAEVYVGQTLKYPVVSENITEVWESSDKNIATVDAAGNITGVGEGECIIRVSAADNRNLCAEVAVTVVKQEGLQVIDGVTYIDGILIANKSYGLPSTYNPGGLTSDTYTAFQELVNGAAADGLNIYNSSGFRSYETQSAIYNNYVSIHGQATADTFSARPGFSEHQTGLAIDVNEISDAFIGTPEAIWIEQHCYEYGFIVRYPKGKQEITGYKYEPWHIRYIGKENAKAFAQAAADVNDPYLTLEEYFGIDSYYH